MKTRWLALGMLSLLAGCNGCKKDPPAQPAKVNPYDISSNAGGGTQGVRNAAYRPVKQNDLDQLKIYIEFLVTETGKFPNAKELRETLSTDRQMGSIWKLIEDGSIVLAPMKQREGIWAYEKLALTEGGIVLSNNGVERMNAPDLQAKLNGQ